MNCCENCNSVTYKHFNSIPLSCQELILETFPAIINDKIHGHTYCSICDELNRTKIDIKDMLCIDVENVSTSESIHLINLNELKSTLTIGMQTLILIGVIAFEEPIGNNKLRYYIAYCRSLQGDWFIYDDATSFTKPLKVKYNSTINPALILYVEYTTILKE